MPLNPGEGGPLVTPVLSNTEIVPNYFRMAFEAPALAAEARPGQFLMLSFPLLKDPLLPRPFAVFNVQGPRVEVLYRRVGKGTGLLARMRAGDPLRVLGPLGNGFRLPDPSVAPIVLAGGCGIASLHLLLLHLLKRQSAPTTLLYGVRFHDELIPLEDLEEAGLLLRIATEDGKRGLKGTVTQLLSTALAPGASSTDAVELFACGPQPMLRAAVQAVKGLGVRAQVSVESRMACGYGVCQGCVFPFHGAKGPEKVRYRKVCTDGPVFAAEEICWEAVPD